jgi:hypothetical protein
MRNRLLLVAALLVACLCAAQRSNVVYVDSFPGESVAVKLTAAQLSTQCANASVPCVLVMDSKLAVYAEGSLPLRCANCLWLDYRSALGLAVNGSLISGGILPWSISSGNLLAPVGKFIRSADLGTPEIKFGSTGGGYATITFTVNSIAVARFDGGVGFELLNSARFVLGSTDFASLPISPTNGSQYYCTDCTKANPTTGGGTGTTVSFENGQWNGGAAGGGGVSSIASGTKALSTSAITSGTCTAAQTASATGTATTDVVRASFNGDPTGVTGYAPAATGMLTVIPYPTANTVNFKVCNNTAGDITPGAITLNWQVLR